MHTPPRRPRTFATATLCAIATWAHAPALAGPIGCAGVSPPRELTRGHGPLESLAFDRQGRLLFTSITRGALLRLPAPGGEVGTISDQVAQPGGIVVTGEREAHVGTGNGLTGLLPWLGAAGIARVDLETGETTQVVRGLAMANGLVRASDGTFYASDDLARSLDRVRPDGTVERGWLALNSNGLALSPDEHTLYVNQMIPPKVLAVDRASGQVRVLAEAPSGRGWTLLDGLGIDSAGTLYVASYLSGEVWRLTPGGRWCTLAKGLTLPSAVTPGASGSGFAADSVYVTTHGGRLLEVPGAVPPPLRP